MGMQIKMRRFQQLYIMQEIRSNRKKEREREGERERIRDKSKKERIIEEKEKESLIFCGGDEKSTSEVFSMCFATCSASYGQTSRVQ